MPPGVPYIVGNEAAERFSYYGMNSILTIFMTKYLLDKMGHLSVMPAAQAEAWYHTFVSALYFLPIFGAILADEGIRPDTTPESLATLRPAEARRAARCAPRWADR